jgi:hypothetical protein
MSFDLNKQNPFVTASRSHLQAKWPASGGKSIRYACLRQNEKGIRVRSKYIDSAEKVREQGKAIEPAMREKDKSRCAMPMFLRRACGAPVRETGFPGFQVLYFESVFILFAFSPVFFRQPYGPDGPAAQVAGGADERHLNIRLCPASVAGSPGSIA